MHHISKATAVITFPARTAFAVASAGLRTTVRLAGWAAEQVVRQGPTSHTTPPPATPRPVVVTEPDVEPGIEPDAQPDAQPEVDPMLGTRTPPAATTAPARKAPSKKAPSKKAPAKKVPASQVPLKSAPTPSLPAALEDFDDASDDAPVPPPTRTATKKAPAKKAAKKAPAKKAPSKQAAVLAPALGLSEDEVAEVVEGGSEQA